MAPSASQVNKALLKKSTTALTMAQIEGHISNHSTTPLTVFSVEVYTERLDLIYDEIVGLYDVILEGCDPADKPTQETERTEFLDKIMQAQISLRAISKQLNPPQQQKPPVGGGIPSSSSAFKLPKLDIPKFSGEIIQWRSFKDLFTATVDKSPISAAQKLQHLKTLLTQEPLSAINGIPITDANYATAWKILCDRYDDDKLLTTSYLNTLLNQPNVKEESASALRKLWDTTTECERSLTELGWPMDQCDFIIVHIVSQRLDTESRRQWEKEAQKVSDLKVDKMGTFILQRCQALEAMGPMKKKPEDKKQKSSPEQKKQSVSHVSASSSMCELCKQNHPIWKCSTFVNASPSERNDLIRKSNLCYNCFRKGHSVRQCQSRNCSKCGQRHNTMLHDDKQGSSTSEEVKIEPSAELTPQGQPPGVSHHVSNNQHQSRVLLQTAIIRVQDGFGSYQDCRALLDSGSDSTFVSERLVQKLQLKQSKVAMSISGVGDTKCQSPKSSVQLVVGSALDPSFTAATTAFVMPVVTTLLPTSTMSSSAWPHLQHLKLADTQYYKSRSIDVLIGGDIYYSILREGLINPMDGAPAAQLTVFGWVLGGPATQQTIKCHFIQTYSDQDITRFWDLDDVPQSSSLSKEEELCEQNFISTHSRDSTGRYVVALPFKPNAAQLGNSFIAARRRFFGLERRLNNNETLKLQYQAFMAEYLALGHMQEVPPSQQFLPESDAYYLPHQAVIREDSSTTKLRVVFDASAKTSNGNSLNDNLLVGPTCQSDLVSVLLRFRQFPIALKADVEKMYRQVNVRPADYPFQRILWRNNPSDQLQQYQLTTVTYGTASAPFLATRALNQLAIDEEGSFPEAAAVVRRDFYVDDLMTSVANEALAISLQRDLIQMCQRGGFPLRKWCSNSPNLLSSVPLEYREPKLSLCISEGTHTIKTLGVNWDVASDAFMFSVKLPQDVLLTKRQILSETARIFDPLGWLAPVTVAAKIIFQQLWKLNLEWDEDLPADSPRKQWLKIRGELSNLQQLSIPRCVSVMGAVRFKLCGFSDASEKAYSAVVYLRSISGSSKIQVSLLQAKTRVAPTKVVSLPKLELCGAVLLCKLLQNIQRDLTIHISDVHAWTDSTIVLAWLNTESFKLKTFVANRVAIVQSQFPRKHWNHVISGDNPADPASRGLLPSELINNKLWWSGPGWLQQEVLPESTATLEPDPEKVAEEFKKSAANVSVSTVSEDMFSRFSSLDRLKRATAYWMRFINNKRISVGPRMGGSLSALELQAAFHRLIYLAQQQSFSEEIMSIQEHDQLPRKSPLIGLKPFVDSNGLIRVGGRIQKSDLPFQLKHPLVIPKDHQLSILVLRDIHVTHLHAGPTLMLASLRHNGLWVIQGKRVARHIISKCVICVRQRAATLTMEMADLPKDRLSAQPAFLTCGVDYCGPFEVKQIHGRVNKTWKIYVAVFVCFNTKAVHLEPVRDMTTEAFIAALRRFVSIRGKPAVIHSDNGTNFQGASRELKELKALEESEEVTKEMASKGIVWKFIPPRAPHFGGIWEAAVKSLKHHLVRVVGSNLLKYDEFDTLLAQVQAILNSRPLIPMTTDPEDMNVLTPGHFLILRAPMAVADPDLTTLKESRLSQWQKIQQKVQHFWKSWRQDYLQTLQQRTKWSQEKSSIKIGDMCVIKEDNLPPKWKLGRIIKLHPGSDGAVRVVTLRTESGECQRPIVKVCVLPASY